jgi:hypothetical protein
VDDSIVSGARVNLRKRLCAEVEVLKTFQRTEVEGPNTPG